MCEIHFQSYIRSQGGVVWRNNRGQQVSWDCPINRLPWWGGCGGTRITSPTPSSTSPHLAASIVPKTFDSWILSNSPHWWTKLEGKGGGESNPREKGKDWQLIFLVHIDGGLLYMCLCATIKTYLCVYVQYNTKDVEWSVESTRISAPMNCWISASKTNCTVSPPV